MSQVSFAPCPPFSKNQNEPFSASIVGLGLNTKDFHGACSNLKWLWGSWLCPETFLLYKALQSIQECLYMGAALI